MLNLLHVQSFIAVVDAGGFRAAARKLGLGVSTIVGHVDRLEADLTTVLLVRERGHLETTVQGARFEPLARALIETSRRARAIVAEAPLHVAAASNIGVYILQPKLAAFEAATGIAVAPWIGSNPEVAERLSCGLADVAIMEWWDGRAGFDALPWLRESLVVIVRPDHPWAKRSVVAPADLIGETLLGGESGSGTGTVLSKTLGDLAARLTTRSGYGSTEAVKRAVRAGHGISIVMASAVEDEVRDRELVVVELRGVRLEKQLTIVVPRGLPPSMPGRRLADQLVEG